MSFPRYRKFSVTLIMNAGKFLCTLTHEASGSEAAPGNGAQSVYWIYFVSVYLLFNFLLFPGRGNNGRGARPTGCRNFSFSGNSLSAQLKESRVHENNCLALMNLHFIIFVRLDI